MKYRYGLLLFCAFFFTGAGSTPNQVTVTRLKYGGGGDWYRNPSSLPNLLRELNLRLKLNTPAAEDVVTPSDTALFSYPLVYMTGHGTVRFSNNDIRQLRTYFQRGGVLWADDNYGMDESFRKEIARVLPNNPLQEIPFDHPIYSIYYRFEKGLPKIHEHYGGPPHLYGIYLKGRLVVFYTYNTDIGDGLESEGVHPKDSPQIREQAMQMAINLVLFVLTS